MPSYVGSWYHPPAGYVVISFCMGKQTFVIAVDKSISGDVMRGLAA
jgi:hypothetical protein